MNVTTVAAGGEQSLAIAMSLQISVQLTGQTPVIRFQTFSGRQYLVEYSPDLQAGSWRNVIGGNITGSGREALVMDNNALQSADTRVYRVRQF